MNKIGHFIEKNKTLLYSIAAMIGVVGTNVVTAKAQAMIDKDKAHRKMSKKEYIKSYWYYYIPSACGCLITCYFIGKSESINKKHIAGLISAYALLEETGKEYRDIVKDIYGEDADRTIKNEIAKKNISDDSIEEGETLFFDEFSGEYFNSDIISVTQAEYHFNRNFILRGYATLNELYTFLEINEQPYGDNLGWSAYAEGDYGYKWIDFEHEKVVTDDGLECYIIRFPFEPHADFMEVG